MATLPLEILTNEICPHLTFPALLNWLQTNKEIRTDCMQEYDNRVLHRDLYINMVIWLSMKEEIVTDDVYWFGPSQLVPEWEMYDVYPSYSYLHLGMGIMVPRRIILPLVQRIDFPFLKVVYMRRRQYAELQMPASVYDVYLWGERIRAGWLTSKYTVRRNNLYVESLSNE